LESLRSSKVGNFESKPIVISPTATVSEIIGTLRHYDAYEVFVQEGSKVGSITMREILKASEISSMRASSLMFYVAKLSPKDTVGRAARLMSDYRLRALPIIGERTIQSAVTAQSLCRALVSVKAFGNAAISKMMKRNPIEIGKNESISRARRLMLESNIDHLPVLDSGKLCGIILSNHIVFTMFPREGLEKGALVSKPAGYLDLKVSGLMDLDTLVCDPKEKASDVLRSMMKQGKTYSIVKLWDEPQGIVTYRDFIAFLAEPEELDIPAYIVGLPDDPFEAELARMKFMRWAKTLCKSIPRIEEMRSTIKTKDISGERRRYEVDVSIVSAGKVYAYSERGWDLPSVFDSIIDKAKRLLTKKRVRRQRESLRKTTS